MEKKFVPYLTDPFTKSALTCYIFEEKDENIIEGLLVNKSEDGAFPIIGGVPVMIKDSFTKEFLEKHKDRLSEINSGNLTFNCTNSSWSFSAEWEAHFEKELNRTWEWTVEERYEQFLMETMREEKDIRESCVLDAGCGNGMLTEHIAGQVSCAFGIDMSDSVFFAEKKRKSKNLCFVKGDLQNPPFVPGTFDVVVSNGVIHHTANTERTFHSCATVVKENGQFYIWLYSRKGNFRWRAKRRFFDVARSIVCRMGGRGQAFFVKMFTNILYVFHRDLDKDELEINIYDALTPRWRHYHTPEEVAHWYYKAGFGPITLTHFDNRFGFGVCATRTKIGMTPGENYKHKKQF